MVGLIRGHAAAQQACTKHLNVLFLLWVGCFAGILYVAALPIDHSTQLWGAGGLMVVLLALRPFAVGGVARLCFLFIAAFCALRYCFWRTFSTLSYNDFFSFLAAILLYLAELYSISLHLLGIFVNVRPLRRLPVPLPPGPQHLPTVDILIPTYNEPPDMLEVTILAALHIRYPRDKFKVYVLDDGGTQQKCHAEDPDTASAARARQQLLQALCEGLGAHYLTRENNEYAKAGNINAALQRTSGELILILDADHIPTVDILEQTVGGFLSDPKLFLVQTPHFFVNPTAIEKNLQTFQYMPGDTDMFYSVTQQGLDFWNASFFCGAAGILRRQHLEEIGGLSGTTITEDAETALALHARGYRSAYLHRPMISGLSPETFSGFITQRSRWAQGMVQIFLLKNPLFQKGLRAWQRLSYVSSSLFWFFAYPRVVFLLIPSAYLCFGLKIYDASLLEILSYAVPHVLCVILVTDYLFGKVRWSFISELYELMQSLFTVRAISTVLLNPRAPTFIVTPKDERVQEDFISPLSRPFYVLFAIIAISLGAGIYRYLTVPLERHMVMITMSWEVFNLVIVLAALGALFERQQRRHTPRIPIDLSAEFLVQNHVSIPCTIRDASVGGMNLVLAPEHAPLLPHATEAIVQVYNSPLGKRSSFRVRLCNARPTATEVTLGVAFAHQTPEETVEKVVFVHGDSNRWIHFLQKRQQHRGIVRSMIFLIRLSVRYSAAHMRVLLIHSWQKLAPRPRSRGSLDHPGQASDRANTATPLRRAA